MVFFSRYSSFVVVFASEKNKPNLSGLLTSDNATCLSNILFNPSNGKKIGTGENERLKQQEVIEFIKD